MIDWDNIEDEMDAKGNRKKSNTPGCAQGNIVNIQYRVNGEKRK
jgi:hypothetical protein